MIYQSDFENRKERTMGAFKALQDFSEWVYQEVFFSENPLEERSIRNLHNLLIWQKETIRGSLNCDYGNKKVFCSFVEED